jgi:cytochrome c553
MKQIMFLATLLAGAAFAVPHTGEVFYKELGCIGCHGDKGQGSEHAPVLAGKDIAYIVQQLEDFQSGARKNATMNSMALMTEGKEISIATWLSIAHDHNSHHHTSIETVERKAPCAKKQAARLQAEQLLNEFESTGQLIDAMDDLGKKIQQDILNDKAQEEVWYKFW